MLYNLYNMRGKYCILSYQSYESVILVAKVVELLDRVEKSTLVCTSNSFSFRGRILRREF
jgi:hypothetical protein